MMSDLVKQTDEIQHHSIANTSSCHLSPANFSDLFMMNNNTINTNNSLTPKQNRQGKSVRICKDCVVPQVSATIQNRVY